MASIGRWLYRLVSICLPCLKSAETDEKEIEDNPSGVNPVENDAEENNQFGNKYPDDLNPFASEEDELNANPHGKAGKEQHEDKYPDDLKPFASDGEEIDYPKELNPFADEKKDEQEIDYPEELNPFAQEEDGEADPGIANQSSLALVHELNPPVKNGSSSTVSLPIKENTDIGKEECQQHEDEYPDSLNPFGSEDEEEDYPEELNPFAQEEKNKAYSALVNQSATTLSNELAAPPSNYSSSKVPLPNDEKLDNEQDESGKLGGEYPDFLNPFAMEDGKTERHEDGYPEELNPFAHENQSSSKIEDPQKTIVPIKDSSPAVPLINEKKKAKSIKKYCAPVPPTLVCVLLKTESAPGVNESAPEVNESAPEVNEPAPEVNESAPEVNEPAPEVNESAPEVNEPTPEVNESLPGDLETSVLVHVTVKVGDYDEALNPFASEDEEATGDTTGILPSSPAQQIAATAYNYTSVNGKGKKAKSLKKRRAPDPPVIASAKEGSATSDIIANQPCASSSSPGSTKA